LLTLVSNYNFEEGVSARPPARPPGRAPLAARHVLIRYEHFLVSYGVAPFFLRAPLPRQTRARQTSADLMFQWEHIVTTEV
jgi:hypothetical protein